MESYMSALGPKAETPSSAHVGSVPAEAAQHRSSQWEGNMSSILSGLYKQLFRSSGDDDVNEVYYPLERGVNMYCSDNSTSLHEAAMNGHVECIRPLLSSGAEVNKPNYDGNTPLHYAAWKGHMECIMALLDNGAEVDAQNTMREQTALVIALQEGHEDCAEAIGSHIRRRSADDRQDVDQHPDLNSTGILQPEIEELKTQLKTARAKNSEYEVHMACMTGQGDVLASQDLGMLEGLLAKVDMDCLRKAIFDKCVQRELNKARDSAAECVVCLSAPKDTCLHPCGHMVATQHRSCQWEVVMPSMLGSLDIQLLVFSRDGDVNDVVSLLERGANVNCKHCDSPLHMAAIKGNMECIKALLDRGAELNIKSDGGRTLLHYAISGSTPLHYAVSNGNVECAKALLENGAEVNIQEEEGSTPLHCAARSGRVECIRDLLNSGAEVNKKDMFGFTPLHDAAGRGGVECIRALLDSGPDVNTRDNDGNIPLHHATYSGSVECIKALLDCGAELNTQGIDGNTPLHVTTCYGYTGGLACTKALLDSGAELNIRDNAGNTAIEKALRHGRHHVAEAIRSHIRRSNDDRQGGDQKHDQNSSGNQRTKDEELRIELASYRSRNEKYEEQLATARAKNDEYGVLMACVTGQGDVLASQDLGMLEGLLAKVDMDCLRKAIFDKCVQRELNKARDSAAECVVCLSAPKDTGLHPCGHIVCQSCSYLIQLCPFCRQTVAETRRVFL
eukprot:gene710-biopygen457